MKSELIAGRTHVDLRGALMYNNDFDASEVKRMYLIENKDKTIVRAWQGHKIEQRWFTAVLGVFRIQLIKIDNWEQPSKNLIVETYILNSDSLNVLHIPAGYVSSIQSISSASKLLVLADYLLDDNNDEHHYEINYFSKS